MVEHNCIVKEKNTTNERYMDNMCGWIEDSCTGTNPMILSLWYQDTDGQEFACDGYAEREVKFCPYCGLKAED